MVSSGCCVACVGASALTCYTRQMPLHSCRSSKSIRGIRGMGTERFAHPSLWLWTFYTYYMHIMICMRMCRHAYITFDLFMVCSSLTHKYKHIITLFIINTIQILSTTPCILHIALRIGQYRFSLIKIRHTKYLLYIYNMYNKICLARKVAVNCWGIQSDSVCRIHIHIYKIHHHSRIG